jgi:hypothetical protein
MWWMTPMLRKTARTRLILLWLTSVLMTSACETSGGGDGDPGGAARAGSEPSGVTIWGCEHAIRTRVGRLNSGWRAEATVVGDLGFLVTGDDLSGLRRHENADIEVKLPVVIEGDTAVTVWVPPHGRQRVALILGDVPRLGPGDSYRIEEGHHAVRFEPCINEEWTAWTAGLALADRGETLLDVKSDRAQRPTGVTLGPWEVYTLVPR